MGDAAYIGKGGIEAVVTDTATSFGAGNTSVKNYTGINIGPAASDRIVIVIARAGIVSSTIHLASALIDGGAASIASNPDATRTLAIFYRKVPTGTTINIRTTYNQATNSGSDDIIVYTMTGQTVDAHLDADASSGESDSAQSISLTTANDGIAFIGLYTSVENLPSPIIADGSLQQGSGGPFFTKYGRAIETVAGTLNVSVGNSHRLIGATWI